MDNENKIWNKVNKLSNRLDNVEHAIYDLTYVTANSDASIIEHTISLENRVDILEHKLNKRTFLLGIAMGLFALLSIDTKKSEKVDENK